MIRHNAKLGRIGVIIALVKNEQVTLSGQTTGNNMGVMGSDDPF